MISEVTQIVALREVRRAGQGRAVAGGSVFVVFAPATPGGGLEVTGEATREVAGDVIDRDTRQVPDKYPTSIRQVTPQEVSVLQASVNPSTRAVLQKVAGLRDREHFTDSVLKPLLDRGLLEMTIPDKARSSKQQYRITEKGRRFLAERATEPK